MCTVYIIKNSVNSLVYIGATTKTLERRFLEHLGSAYRSSHFKIHCAMRELGVGNFWIEPLEENIPNELRNSRETYWISYYNSMDPNFGYNVCSGGQGVVTHTEETRRHLSQLLTGRTYSEERNEKIRQAMIGRDYKDEWRQHLSDTRKGKFLAEDNPFYGKHHTQETKDIISKRNAKPVAMIDKVTGETLNVFKSARAAAKFLYEQGVTPTLTLGHLINKVCCGTYDVKSCYGYNWKRVNLEDVSTNCTGEDELHPEVLET